MLGVSLFYQVYLNLGEECRNKILGNIFFVNDVSVSSLELKDNEIYIKLFDGVLFYQYKFMIFSNENRIYYSVRTISKCDRFEDLNQDDVINLSLLSKIFLSNDEYQFYQLLKSFL